MSRDPQKLYDLREELGALPEVSGAVTWEGHPILLRLILKCEGIAPSIRRHDCRTVVYGGEAWMEVLTDAGLPVSQELQAKVSEVHLRGGHDVQ